MPIVTYDTSVFIAYKPVTLPDGFRMSAVVLQELTAGALDKSEVQYWSASRLLHEKAGTLLVPTGEDWWLAGKALNSLRRGLKSKAKGKTPKLHRDEKARIIRDVLIARTARRGGALLVTDSLNHFETIKLFCNVRIQSGAEFLTR
jgi:predicted nucleic acid-binding protein